MPVFFFVLCGLERSHLGKGLSQPYDSLGFGLSRAAQLCYQK